MNLCGATAPRDEHRQGARLFYVETDPVYEQMRIANGDGRRSASSRATTCSSRTARTSAPPTARVPLERFTWKPTRPPVVLDAWAARTGPGARCFTTIASWENKGKDVTFRGETYHWSKHVNFLRFLDLPRARAAALPARDGSRATRPCARASRGTAGSSSIPRPISGDVDAYRDFIDGSRGEFTVAKDIYVRPRSGWFSDRSVCYLAAGKPVVTQDTGFSKFVPTGEGLFAFSTMEEAVDALARIDADYARTARRRAGSPPSTSPPSASSAGCSPTPGSASEARHRPRPGLPGA